MATKKNTKKRTSRGGKTSPYLVIAGVLCLIAVLLVVAIVILASQPPAPAEDPVSADPSEPAVSETPSVPPASAVSSEDPASSASSDEGYDLPSLPDEESEPQVGPGGVITQPVSTREYEKEIGVCYSIDMTEFEQYVCPADPMEYVFLVNPTHTLASDYRPDDMIWIQDMKPGRPESWSYLREYAEKALEAFLEEGRQYGIDDVGVSNGFRSYSSQASLFNGYIEQERAAHPDWTEEQIIAYVLTYSTRPGTSEHQSGLCVDMHNRPQTDISFAGTEAALWLEANCYRFGFILRYPEDKQDITGIMFEPWHFRFVGRVAATEMYELGMCLEEYCAYKGID